MSIWIKRKAMLKFTLSYVKHQYGKLFSITDYRQEKRKEKLLGAKCALAIFGGHFSAKLMSKKFGEEPDRNVWCNNEK